MGYRLKFRDKNIKGYGDEESYLEFPIPGSEIEVVVYKDGVTKTWSWKIETYNFYISSNDYVSLDADEAVMNAQDFIDENERFIEMVIGYDDAVMGRNYDYDRR